MWFGNRVNYPFTAPLKLCIVINESRTSKKESLPHSNNVCISIKIKYRVLKCQMFYFDLPKKFDDYKMERYSYLQTLGSKLTTHIN